MQGILSKGPRWHLVCVSDGNAHKAQWNVFAKPGAVQPGLTYILKGTATLEIMPDAIKQRHNGDLFPVLTPRFIVESAIKLVHKKSATLT